MLSLILTNPPSEERANWLIQNSIEQDKRMMENNIKLEEARRRRALFNSVAGTAEAETYQDKVG